MTTAIDQEPKPDIVNRRRLVASPFGMLAYLALFMFLPAGDWTWTAGWVFALIFLGSLTIAALYLWRVNPGVFAARTNFPAGTKHWDRILVWFLLPAFLLIVPVAALDAGRFHSFPVPGWVYGVGIVVFLGGTAIVTWAQSVNRFFEVTVRIQTERGHHVIDTGPYAIVRHPGYVGGAFFALGTALSLGSMWALVPAGLVCVLMILRTRWEDQTLQAELPGYREYTQRTRYRLIPGVW
jgi:protein-S-isoprenylcysteine O-methyltransferase Ste14